MPRLIARRRLWPLLAAGLLLAILAAAWGTWRDPYLMVRAEFERQRLFAGLSAGRVQAAGHRWAYAYREERAPDAPTIVMIHGFTGSKENWYPLARALDEDYRLLVPDLPGWGQSQRRRGIDYGFVQQAAHVDAFIRALSPDAPVILLGHSMGGGIAALVAARYPKRIAAVGLIDAAGVRFRDNAFGLDVLAGENPFAVRDDASLQRYVDIVFHDEQAKPWIPWPASAGLIRKRRADAAFEQAVLDRIGRGEEAMLPGREAGAIRQPALLLWCRQDRVIDPSALDAYAARIPQARKVLLDGCGHMAIVERPREVAAAVAALAATAAR
jgi:abhydrolase domain-containing protein 6